MREPKEKEILTYIANRIKARAAQIEEIDTGPCKDSRTRELIWSGRLIYEVLTMVEKENWGDLERLLHDSK